ncbi:MAG: hypothetical protein AAFY26_02130 [Cyanobacteria bacterium J06638_22]
MEEREEQERYNENFFYFLRWNTIQLAKCWWTHMRSPSNEFWLMMAWNAPIFDEGNGSTLYSDSHNEAF